MRRSLVMCGAAMVCAAYTARASAQSWSDGRTAPPLWQIISVDPSGETDWPYGQEDPAGDGVGTLEADEASTDLRTLYADADPGRLWLRAYVTSSAAPESSVVAFFFIDTDRDSSTGGSADDTSIFRAFDTDPTGGGYELAVGVDASGAVIDSYRYREQSGNWQAQPMPDADVNVEVGADRDPISSDAVEYGYFQIGLAHGLSGLDSDCDARVFVRLYNDDPDRDFGDDDDEGEALCRARLNDLGDPVVLATDGCSSDADCPAGGDCQDGICVFDYRCGGDVDCRTGESCEGGRCVVVIDRSCTSDDDCDGLVCDGGQCVACSDRSACGGNLVCSSVGRCTEPAGPGSAGASGASGAGGTGTAGVDTFDGDVRGGACNCSAPGGTRRGRGHWLLALGLLVPYMRTRSRRRGARRAGRGGER